MDKETIPMDEIPSEEEELDSEIYLGDDCWGDSKNFEH